MPIRITSQSNPALVLDGTTIQGSGTEADPMRTGPTPPPPPFSAPTSLTSFSLQRQAGHLIPVGAFVPIPGFININLFTPGAGIDFSGALAFMLKVNGTITGQAANPGGRFFGTVQIQDAGANLIGSAPFDLTTFNDAPVNIPFNLVLMVGVVGLTALSFGIRMFSGQNATIGGAPSFCLTITPGPANLFQAI